MPFAAAAAIAPVAAAGIGALAGGSKGSSGSSQQQTSNIPWGPQQSYLTNGFQNAQSVYNQESQVPLPSWYVAGASGNQQSAAEAAANLGQGYANGNYWGGTTNAGNTLTSGANAFEGGAQGLASGGIGNESSATNALRSYALGGGLPGQTSTLNTGLQGTEQGVAGNTMGALNNSIGVSNQAASSGLNSMYGTNAALQGAAAMSNNPTLNASIDAANRDVNRDLTENTLPQIQAQAMAGGNANSSREGALEAIATRGASDQMADTAAQMRASAYNNGANIGATTAMQGLTSANGAASNLNNTGVAGLGAANATLAQQQNADQFGTSAQLSALGTAGQQDLAYQTNNAGAQATGLGLLGQGLQTGTSALTAAQNGQSAGANLWEAGGQQQTANDQAMINNGLTRYQYQTQQPSNILQNYWNIVGKPVGTEASSTSSSGGGLGGALAGAIGGLTAGSSPTVQNYLSGLTGTSTDYGTNAAQMGGWDNTGSTYDTGTNYNWGASPLYTTYMS
jgi:hypothetical protein